MRGMRVRSIPARGRLGEPLSEREREVLRAIADGLTMPEVAARLGISPQTVKNHTMVIYRKLGASSAAHAVWLGHEVWLFRERRSGRERRR
jgi:LuxR family maltose regulon positive regulatory protein